MTPVQSAHLESGAPLAGLRVVTLEHALAAPLCSRHLADLGADVIKVERPEGGDLARSYDSVVNGQSAYFVWANRGKRSVALDLTDSADHWTLQRLLANADVFVHNLGPGAVSRLGFDAEVLARLNPSLINCAISGYGADGPYRARKAFDLLIQGEAGLLSVTGEGDSPAKVGISVADMCSAMYGLASILAALHQRTLDHRGSFIDIAMLDCLSEWMMAPVYHQMYGHVQLPREGARHNMFVPYGVYPVGKGEFVNFAVQTGEQWKSFCEIVMSAPELGTDPRFLSNELRLRNRSVLEQLIDDRLVELSADEVVTLLEQAGIPFGEVRDLQSLVDHPQLAARRRWIDIDTPSGPAQGLRAPFNISCQQEGPQTLPSGAHSVPALGEHTNDVRKSLLEDDSRWPGRAEHAGDFEPGRAR